jgi:hypothetical protein
VTVVGNLKKLLCVEEPLQVAVWNLEPAHDLLPFQEFEFDGGVQTVPLQDRTDDRAPPRDIEVANWRLI